MHSESPGSYGSAYLYLALILGAIFFYLLLGQFRQWKKQKHLLKNFGSLGWSRFSLEDLTLLYDYAQEEAREGLQVDTITWNDLEMDELLLKNQCFYSSLGAQHVYASFHYFEEEAVLKGRKDLISMGQKDQDVSLLALYQLGAGSGANLPYLVDHATRSVFPYWFLLGMTLLMLLVLVTIPFQKTLGFLAFGILSLFNSFIYSRGSKKIKDRIHSADYFLMLLKTARRLEKNLSDEQKDYKEELKKALEPFRFVRSSSLNVGISRSPEMTAIKDMIDAFLLDSLRKYARIASVLKQNPKAGHRLIHLVGEVELALFMRSMKKNKNL